MDENDVITTISATVMGKTKDTLEAMMKGTQLTMGEVIDRLALQMSPTDGDTASVIASEQVAICFSHVPKDEFREGYLNLVTILCSILSPAEMSTLRARASMSRRELINVLAGREPAGSLPAELIQQIQALKDKPEILDLLYMFLPIAESYSELSGEEQDRFESAFLDMLHRLKTKQPRG